MRIRHPEIILTALIFTLLAIVALVTNTTGDPGDGVNHYLYARYAFKYPDIFFNHWAKPVFILVTCLPAQAGFIGIQLFNFLCAALSALFTFYTLRSLNVKYAYLAFLIPFFSPLYFKFLFSGLTEYLFALILSLGIYSESRSRHVSTAMLISFLPLVRSEGLLIAGVFAVYFILARKYKYIPLLLSGQVLYSFVGAIYHKDLLWVFSEIPYISSTSPYGHGKPFDFINRLNYTVEKPIFILLIIGLLISTYQFFRNKNSHAERFKTVLICGGFLVFLVAHSIFWWKGIFNSMGLPRVLISILPLIAMLCAFGMDFILEKIKTRLLKYTALALMLSVIVFYPFTNRAQGIVFNAALFEIPENELISREVQPFIQKEFPDYRNFFFYYSHPYLNIALNIDPFDYFHHKEMAYLPNDTNLPEQTLVIWDDWYARIEGGISWEAMKNDARFQLLKEFETQEKEHRIKFAVFKSLKGS